MSQTSSNAETRALPDSSWMRSSTSLWRSSTRSCTRDSTAVRSRSGRAAQSRCAARALFAARATSSGVDSGIAAIGLPVNGACDVNAPAPGEVTTRRRSGRTSSGSSTYVASGSVSGSWSSMCPGSCAIPGRVRAPSACGGSSPWDAAVSAAGTGSRRPRRAGTP